MEAKKKWTLKHHMGGTLLKNESRKRFQSVVLGQVLSLSLKKPQKCRCLMVSILAVSRGNVIFSNRHLIISLPLHFTSENLTTKPEIFLRNTRCCGECALPQFASWGASWSGRAEWGKWRVRVRRPQAQRRLHFWTGPHTGTVWWRWWTSRSSWRWARRSAGWTGAAGGTRP